jgi:dihydrofolate reductase
MQDFYIYQKKSYKNIPLVRLFTWYRIINKMKMKSVLVFVSTLDGKVIKWDNSKVRSWSSLSDQQYFKQLWDNSRLIVMGSNTYRIDQPKVSSNQRLIIMTRDPAYYKDFAIPGQLEFTNALPSQLFLRCEKEGYEQMLIVGGPHIATSFLKEQLIDELWLTIEPKIFGKGLNFAMEEKLDIDLRLISYEKVNEQGTLITRYALTYKTDYTD